MGICPNCGSWVDEGDICMNCGGSGSYSYEGDDENDQYEEDPLVEKAKALSDEAWMLENEGKFEEALVLINRVIENYPCDFNDFNRKAIILQDMCRYEEALTFYDRALRLSRSNVVRVNKADCMVRLLKMKRVTDPYTQKDLDFINEALKILPEGEDNYSCLHVKGDILAELGDPVKARICYFLADKYYDKVDEASRQLKSLKPDERYINITGTQFYESFRPFSKGTILDLIKEPDNPHDRNAIRVELDGETVGYVANSPYTLIREVKSATDIKNSAFKHAVVEFILLGEWIIARLTG